MTGRISCRFSYGKAVFKGFSVEFRAFRITDAWTRDAAHVCGTRRPGTQSAQNVHPGGSFNGTIYSDTVEHEPSTIIMLTSSRTRGQTAVEDGAVLLRLRPQAPRLLVQGVLPTCSDNYFGQHVAMFEGNADILSVDEAELLGVRVPRGYVEKFFNPEEVEARFRITELQPGVSDKPQFAAVSTATGVEVMELPSAPSRRIRIRR